MAQEKFYLKCEENGSKYNLEEALEKTDRDLKALKFVKKYEHIVCEKAKRLVQKLSEGKNATHYAKAMLSFDHSQEYNPTPTVRKDAKTLEIYLDLNFFGKDWEEFPALKLNSVEQAKKNVKACTTVHVTSNTADGYYNLYIVAYRSVSMHQTTEIIIRAKITDDQA